MSVPGTHVRLLHATFAEEMDVGTLKLLLEAAGGEAWKNAYLRGNRSFVLFQTIRGAF